MASIESPSVGPREDINPRLSRHPTNDLRIVICPHVAPQSMDYSNKASETNFRLLYNCTLINVDALRTSLLIIAFNRTKYIVVVQVPDCQRFALCTEQ